MKINLKQSTMNGAWGAQPAVKIPSPHGGGVWSINADFTASGMIYPPIERFIARRVLPYYSNVHSNAHNGQLMSHYIEQSKQSIRRSVGAKPCDRVIMTGNGCSGAIAHLIHLLNIRVETNPKTVVFISVAEHHSNILPWKHLPVILDVVPLLEDGTIDTVYLLERLQRYDEAGHPLICSFIAGSNVTGVIQPFYDITRAVRNLATGGVLVFWDFAGCGPYVKIQMHRDKWSYFDAIMMSPHKMLGGPGTPGLLVANHRLFRNEEPYCPGGGTVRFVCRDFTHYSTDLEKRETGGTPNIIGAIKMGLVFQLKDRSLQKIIKRNIEINRMVREHLREHLREHPIIMLNPDVDLDQQFPVYSYVIRGYHYNFIVALLNDFYGIQSRGGVSCCSLYAQVLLRLTEKENQQVYQNIISGKGVPQKYGWCRITFHYTMSDAVVFYILRALDNVGQYGYRWHDRYEYNQEKNRWYYCGVEGHEERPRTEPLDYLLEAKSSEGGTALEVLTEQQLEAQYRRQTYFLMEK